VPFEVIELATPGFALVHTLVPIDAATFAGGDLGA
jgi:hypothetical protein